jgi:hypothetical protein
MDQTRFRTLSVQVAPVAHEAAAANCALATFNTCQVKIVEQQMERIDNLLGNKKDNVNVLCFFD